MQIVSDANETVLVMLKRFKKKGTPRRPMKYCVETTVDDGILLFNVLTRELVLLNKDEYAHLTESEELIDHWFVVPESMNEKELVEFVRWIHTTRKKPLQNIRRFSIFPTTDCNARCFYCFEKGCSRIPMSGETAQKVVRYIKDHAGEEKVQLAWFGGEPLLNQSVIDIICTGLRREGVNYYSTMVSNGYLLDEITVQKAVGLWNLQNVQITLDGTEEIYNRSKAYVYREGSPYQVVLNNLNSVLNASIRVYVRLNLDLHNADNLMELVDELAQRFSGRTGLRVYAYHLYDKENPQAFLHSQEGWKKRIEAMRRLNDRIDQYGFAIRKGIIKTFQVNHCMADSGSSVTILPTGDIGLCDHHLEDELIGHIDREGFDTEIVTSWQEHTMGSLECAECIHYPSCIRLKKCTSTNICFDRIREEKSWKLQREILYEYEKWKSQNTEEEADEDELC